MNTRPLPERFWEKVRRAGPDECWEWIAAKQSKGYGHIYVDGTVRDAHRVSFYLEHGRWPQPNCLHSCDNPSCVNPAHLREGTQSENIIEMFTKGRRAHIGRKVPLQTIRDIRANYLLCRVKQNELAARFGISKQYCSTILRDLIPAVRRLQGVSAQQRGTKWQ